MFHTKNKHLTSRRRSVTRLSVSGTRIINSCWWLHYYGLSKEQQQRGKKKPKNNRTYVVPLGETLVHVCWLALSHFAVWSRRTYFCTYFAAPCRVDCRLFCCACGTLILWLSELGLRLYFAACVGEASSKQTREEKEEKEETNTCKD